MNEPIEKIDSAIEESEATAEINETAEITEDEEQGDKSPVIDDENSMTEDEEKQTDYALLEAEDLATIRALFDEYQTISSITELDNPLRYATLRDLGLSVKEAFLATQRKQPRYNNRSHLKSSVPRGARSDGVSMSAEALREAREIFSGLSDSEIQKLYKNVIK